MRPPKRSMHPHTQQCALQVRGSPRTCRFLESRPGSFQRSKKQSSSSASSEHRDFTSLPESTASLLEPVLTLLKPHASMFQMNTGSACLLSSWQGISSDMSPIPITAVRSGLELLSGTAVRIYLRIVRARTTYNSHNVH